jgi:hypothetical protein
MRPNPARSAAPRGKGGPWPNRGRHEELLQCRVAEGRTKCTMSTLEAKKKETAEETH